MKQNQPSHLQRYYKNYIIGLLFFLLLVFIGGWLLSRHYKPVLSDKLKKQIYTASDSLYHIRFSDIHLHILAGNIAIDSVRILPDSTAYRQLKKKHQESTDLLHVSMNRIKVKHFHLLSFFFKKKLKIKTVQVDHPVVTISHQQDSLSPRKSHKENPIENLVSGSLKAIDIQNINLFNGKVNYKNIKQSKSGNFSLEKVDLKLRGIKIDSLTAQKPSRLRYIKDLQLQLKSGFFYTPNKLYKISTQSVHLSLEKGEGWISDLKVSPQLSEQAFDQGLHYRKNLFKVSVDSVLIDGFSFKDFKNELWHLQELSLKSGTADIYLNAALPVEEVNKPLPQKMLRHAGVDLLIDSLLLRNMDIIYREKNPKSKKIGKVTFNNIHGYLNNITNDTEQIRQNKYSKADLHTMFMEQGKLHALFSFNLADSSNDLFSYKGYLSNLKASALNPATRPLGMVKIDSGNIPSLAYNMRADRSGASGLVALQYDHLGVEVLSKENLQEQELPSLAANVLVIKNSNIHDSTLPRQKRIRYERDPYRSVFNLMWKSIFTGVKPLIGVDQKTQENIKSFKKGKKEIKKKPDNFGDKAKQFIEKTIHKIGGQKQ